MSLSRKTGLVIGITLISLIVILSVLTRFLLLDSFSRLEEADTRQQASRASAVLVDSLNQLNNAVWDWAAWDDTYAFMLDGNDAYLKTNLVDSTFITLRLNVLLFVSTTGQVVFGQGFEAQQSQALPADLTTQLLAHTVLLHPTDIKGNTVGIVALPRGVLLVASQPVLTSKYTGPSHGTVIFGRWLDAAEVERLSAIAHVSITALRWDDPALPPEDRAVQAALSDQLPISVRPLTDQTVAGYTRVTDIDGQPVLLLRVTASRLIYAQGQSTLTYFVLSLLAVGLAFSIMMPLLLERLVLSRLRQLNAGVSAIEQSGDQIARVPAAGRDELANLGRAINAMLDALQHSAETLRASEERYRILFENTGTSIIIIEEDATISLANEEFARRTGYTRSEIEGGKRWTEIVDREDLERLLAQHQLRRERPGDATPSYEFRYRTKSGDLRNALINVQLVPGTKKSMASLMDITDRMQAEEALRIQHNLSLALGSSDDLHQALEQILEAALRLEGIDCGGIYVTDQSGALELVVHCDLSLQFIEQAAHYPAEAPQARLAWEGQIRYGSYPGLRPVSDAASDHEDLRGLAVIPVVHQGRLLAVLNLASHTHDDIPVNTRRALETLAQQIGSILMRLHADAALRESRQNLQTLFDTVDDFLFVLDGTGHILQVNAVTSNRLGYTTEELVGQDVLMTHPPDRRAEAAAIIADMLAGRRDFCPVPIQAKDGTLIPVETRVTPGTWSGKPALFGLSRDITERQQAEAALQRAHDELERRVQERTVELALANQALREDEERFRTVADYTYDWETWRGPDGRHLYVSPSCERITSYRPDEFYADSGLIEAIAYPVDRASMARHHNVEFASKEMSDFDLRITIRGGEERWLNHRCQPVYGADGRWLGRRASYRDITARRQAEDQIIHLNRDLTRRNQELAALHRASQTVTATLDLDRVLQQAITEIKNLLKAQEASVLLQEDGELIFVATTHANPSRLMGTRLPLTSGIAGWVMQTGQAVLIEDAHRDPRFYDRIDALTGLTTHSLLAAPLAVKGALRGVIEVVNKLPADDDDQRPSPVFDAHDLDMLEAIAGPVAIALENARLYQQEQAQLRRLQESQARLVQAEKMSALGRLTASIAHEINNPLQAVRSGLSLVIEILDEGGSQEEMRQDMVIVWEELERIVRIVGGLREFARPSHQGLQPTDVLAVLGNVLELVNKQFQHSRVTFEPHWTPDLPTVQANPDRLKQVFMNLIINAFDAMPRGGTLQIATILDHRSQRGDRPAPWVRIEFSDCGEGIAPEVQAHLFEPFVTTKSGGTGLGLSISYEIIQAMRGEITFVSQPGVGTTFTVWLPTAAALVESQ